MSVLKSVEWREADTIQTASTTFLNLLTRDGALDVEFSPVIESHHYAELFEIVKAFDSEAVAKLLLVDAAKRCGRSVTF